MKVKLLGSYHPNVYVVLKWSLAFDSGINLFIKTCKALF